MISSSHSESCLLCGSHSKTFLIYGKSDIIFYRCSNCYSIFKEKASFPNSLSEKIHYEAHNNDVSDEAYQSFVQPITDHIELNYSNTAMGLDYGCGSGPVATHVLTSKGFTLKLFDPYFQPNTSYTDYEYDYIICCEVMEHFHEPQKEFEHLVSLLKPSGRLYCKTSLVPNNYNPENLKKWYYKNDPTHVFFYSPKSLDVIVEMLNFKSVTFDEKLIIFKK